MKHGFCPQGAHIQKESLLTEKLQLIEETCKRKHTSGLNLITSQTLREENRDNS